MDDIPLLPRSHRVTPYYWIVTEFGGRMVVIGPKASEQEATDFGYATLDAQFTVVELPTRDRARATSIIKAKKLAETGNLGDSLRFARHQWPPSTQPTTEAEPDSDMEGS